MRFAFSDEQQQFGAATREALARACPAAAVRAAWQDGPSRARWALLAELGVVGLSVPEAYGGLGLGELDLVLPLEEAGRAALPEPLVETTLVAAPLLVALGSDELKQRWLPALAAGRALVAVGLAGQSYVAHADSADLLLLVRGDDELHALEPAAVALRAAPSVDGARRLYSVEWEPTPATRVAAGEAARRALGEAFERGALGAAAQLCGLGRHLLDVTVEYVQVRRQFGQPVGAFQAVKHHLADALVGLELARPVVHRAAWSLARESPERATHVSMAKLYASTSALRAARAALQCHGAIGYSFEHDLHLWMKRAWALAAAWGDAAWHRARVANAILGGA
jgi:alkylation response protein AidB-like acyl-CoA dehydrogenase